MKKSKCEHIKNNDKSEEILTHELLKDETLKSHKNDTGEYKYTSNHYCFAPAHSFSKKFLETFINTDDKTVLELMCELDELLENEKIRLQKIVNNENLYDNNCFTSALRGSKVFLKEQVHGRKILKKLK